MSPVFNVTLDGVIAVNMGSPNSNGTFWTAAGYPPDESIAVDSCLTTMLRKIEAIRTLFADEGKTFEIQGYDGGASMKFNPRIKGLDFKRGNNISWFNKCEYSITMECDRVSVDGVAVGEDTGFTDHIERADETWNIESADETNRTFRLTHQVSAKGTRFYDETGTLTQQAWENAKDYVLNVIGLGLDVSKMIAAGVLDATLLQAYNYVRSQNVNEGGGTFSVNETWICYDPDGGSHAIEDFQVNTRTTLEGISTVSVDGTIKGFEVRDNSTYALISTKYTNASSKYGEISPTLFGRAQTISGVTLNPDSISSSLGKNENTGVITYAVEYNDRPGSIIAGAISESIVVSYENPVDVFAKIPIIGRALGPIYQDLETITETKKNLSIEIIMGASSYSSTASEPNTDALVATYSPFNIANVFTLDRDTRSWDVIKGRYSRQVSWSYEV